MFDSSSAKNSSYRVEAGLQPLLALYFHGLDLTGGGGGLPRAVAGSLPAVHGPLYCAKEMRWQQSCLCAAPCPRSSHFEYQIRMSKIDGASKDTGGKSQLENTHALHMPPQGFSQGKSGRRGRGDAAQKAAAHRCQAGLWNGHLAECLLKRHRDPGADRGRLRGVRVSPVPQGAL